VSERQETQHHASLLSTINQGLNLLRGVAWLNYSKHISCKSHSKSKVGDRFLFCFFQPGTGCFNLLIILKLVACENKKGA
jgi:hypothetical protein